MIEVFMFVKPTDEECCIVLTFLKDGKVYIHKAYLIDNITECVYRLKDILSNPEESYPINRILFDAGLFTQEALSLRNDIDTELLLYSNKKKFEYRVVNQADYIKDFVFRKTQSAEYTQFMTLFGSFSKADKYNIAIDVLCDISRYYRTIFE